MAAQAGLCLAWSKTPEDTFCRVVAQIKWQIYTVICMYITLIYVHVHICIMASNITISLHQVYLVIGNVLKTLATLQHYGVSRDCNAFHLEPSGLRICMLNWQETCWLTQLTSWPPVSIATSGVARAGYLVTWLVINTATSKATLEPERPLRTAM